MGSMLSHIGASLLRITWVIRDIVPQRERGVELTPAEIMQLGTRVEAFHFTETATRSKRSCVPHVWQL
jgi:hypothetical protein